MTYPKDWSKERVGPAPKKARVKHLLPTSAPLFTDHIPLKKGDVVSLVGSGGKTTLMYHLARELTRQGMRIITTTTTKIFPPYPSESPRILLIQDQQSLFAEAKKLLSDVSPVTLAERYVGAKLKGLSPTLIDILHDQEVADIIIVEADGARGCPLKAPNETEPVIPASTTWTIAVAGLEGNGKPNAEEYVFRPQIFSRLSGLKVGETVTPQAITQVILHPHGLTRGTPENARVAVVLNQADVEGGEIAGAKIAELILKANKKAFLKILVTSLLPRPQVMVAYGSGARAS